jgi:recombination protein RecA
VGTKRKRTRARQLDAAVAAIQGRFGPWALVKGKPATGGAAGTPTVAHIPTGFPELDRALGIGGLPRGRVTEIVGPATSGKTTLTLKFLAGAQKAGQVGYVDQALYLDADYAHRCGADLSRMTIGSPQTHREALAMVESLLHLGGLAALVLDTLDFLWTDPEAVPDLAATLGRLSALVARSETAVVVLHDSATATSPALSALAHLAAVRLRVTREDWIRDRGDVRGYHARVEVLKNKLGPAGRTASIAIEFNGTVRGDGL